MINTVFKGSAVALVTPFNETGINYDELKRLIDFQIKEGTDALVIMGTTGEPATMLEEEKAELLHFCGKYIARRVPFIAGCGSNDTAHSVGLSIEAEKAGADALLIVTPYYNKCTQKGLIAHYTAIADAVSLPIIMYNVPGRTGVNILPATAAELAKHPNIAAIKEASGNIEQISELARLTEGTLDLYSGDDAIVLPIAALGGKGVISVAANIIPRHMHEIAAAALAKDFDTCRKLQLEILPLVRALFSEVNPIPVKTALNLMGFNAGKLRLPLTEMSDACLAQLKTELQAWKLI